MKLMLLGIAIIIFGTGFIVPGGFAVFGWGMELVGLIITFIGLFKKENK